MYCSACYVGFECYTIRQFWLEFYHMLLIFPYPIQSRSLQEVAVPDLKRAELCSRLIYLVLNCFEKFKCTEIMTQSTNTTYVPSFQKKNCLFPPFFKAKIIFQQKRATQILKCESKSAKLRGRNSNISMAPSSSRLFIFLLRCRVKIY